MRARAGLNQLARDNRGRKGREKLVSVSNSNHSGSDHSSCRFCGGALESTFVDLGMSPLCESFLSADQLSQMEPFYPLRVTVCEKCFLVQLPAFVTPEHIFTEYAYFSSYSDSWLAHAKRYTDQMTQQFGLGGKSLVVELASNDAGQLRCRSIFRS